MLRRHRSIARMSSDAPIPSHAESDSALSQGLQPARRIEGWQHRRDSREPRPAPFPHHTPTGLFLPALFTLALPDQWTAAQSLFPTGVGLLLVGMGGGMLLLAAAEAAIPFI